MSFCGTVIRQVTWLERQAQAIISQICTIEPIEECADWKDEGQQECKEQRDEGYNKCTEQKDEGYSACSQTKDEGYSKCCDWAPCSWFCDAFVWVSNVVCVAWTWVSNIVCVAWTWVSNIVCVVWKWVSKWICRVIHWFYTTICKLIVSIVFTFIRVVLNFIFFIPCKFHTPALDNRIKHIFVLVLENRSFDHIFGETEIEGHDAATGQGTLIDRRPPGTTNQWKDDNQVTQSCPVGPGQARSVGVDPGHEFGDTVVALGGPSATYPPYPAVNNLGFAQSFANTLAGKRAAGDSVPATPCSIMQSYTERDVPVITALAREFAICDGWFSAIPGPTVPNRLFYHAASSAGLDDSPSGFDSGVKGLIEGFMFDNGTIYDLLDSENIDWAVYHGDAFPQALSLSGMNFVTTQKHFHDMDDFEEDLADGSIASYVFIEPDYGDDITGSTYKCGNSQHPLDDITHGERLIKRVYEAIRNSPVREESLLIIGYDEGGGFYDHRPPGKTVPPGDSITDPNNNFNNFDFSQLGVRVPGIVVSPWIPRHTIDHREYEHASVLATVERLWDLPNLTDRDRHARDLIDLLSLSSPRTDCPAALPDAAASEANCDEDKGAAVSATAGLTSAERSPRATLVDPISLSLARQRNPTAIASTAASFLAIAVRRDLMLAPRSEHEAIFNQARRFRTMGELGEYATRVIAEIDRANR